MHMALTADEWLDLNARHCNRYRSRMTQESCEGNRKKSDDCRCAGCDGLEDEQREFRTAAREPSRVNRRRMTP